MKTGLKTRKVIRNFLIFFLIIIFLLIFRIGWIQFINGEELQAMAYNQQTLDRKINPKRGTIYDATGETVLAISSSVETVSVNPTTIKGEDKEKVAKALSEIFELDYETVLKKVKKKTSIETIIKKVDKEKTDELRAWLIENNIDHGINIDEDTKRYYPFGNLASQVIGFCGSDNQGLDGIEARYDSTLKGEYGKIEKVIDATGGKSNNESESYVEAVDGKDLVLTIDMTIQSIAEKYLKNACIDNNCTDGGNVIIMNPKTGDILAMAGYPNYNLNEPYEAYTDELKAVWDSLSNSEQTAELQKVWRNKAIADTYEPGSVFKLLTASAAIEEGIAEPDKSNQYNCSGSIEVAGVRIRCWRYYRPHGSQSLREALMNSCNPVFIGLGQTLGVEKYYEYLEKFGMLERTGIDLYGEAASIFLKKEKVGPVELATIAFGQRFEVTPIQMVRMVSVIANKGIEVKPRIVKEIRDSETGEIQEIPVEETGRVISEETANSVLSMMESVVAEGTGKGATVLGYRVGGKTGTSEDGVNTNKFIASFMGVAPIEDPGVVILATLYNPTGEGGHQGGGIGSPLVGKILSEVLPYLEVSKTGEVDEEDVKEIVTVPEIRGLSIKEAKESIKDLNLDLKIEGMSDEEFRALDYKSTIIKEQSPKPRN